MFPQWTEIVAKQDFTIKQGKGRPCIINSGDLFVVTNPEYMQNSTSLVKVARKKNAKLNQGYDLTVDQIDALFKVE